MFLQSKFKKPLKMPKLCYDCAVIAMDYQKNMPLLLTGVSQEYYKRQLWIHNFCIHDTVQDQATMFVYAENYAGKDQMK